MSPRADSAMLLLALVLAGCGSTPTEAPRRPAGPPAGEPLPPAGSENPEAEPAPRDAPAPERPSPTVSKLVKRPNGLRVLRVDGRPGELARLALFVDAGRARDRVGKPVLAELSARCLRRSGEGGRPGEALDVTLETLGARLDVSVAGRWVRIETVCPAEHLVEVARTLFRFVTQPPPPAPVIRREGLLMAREMRATRSARQRELDLRILLGESGHSLASEERAVASFGPAEVRLFVGLHYRPDASLLAVMSAPGEKGVDAVEIGKVFDDWKRDAPLPPLSPAATVLPLGYARRDTDSAEVIASIRSPALELSGRATEMVLWNLLCLDGVGGTLRARLDKTGFADVDCFVSELDTGRTRARSLTMRIAPNRVEQLIAVVRESFADLTTNEPDRHALSVVKRRTLLRLDERMSNPRDRLRLLARAALAGHPADLEQRVVRNLEALRPDDTTDAAQRSFAPAILVRGPLDAKPKGARTLPPPQHGVSVVAEVEPIKPLGLEPDATAALARETLTRTVRALGGIAALRTLETFAFEARCSFTASIPFLERWRISLPEGPFARDRVLLGTAVRTEVDKGRAFEAVGEEQRPLTPNEATFFRLEAALHPTVFFALQAREKIDLTAIGKMAYANRTLLVFEWRRADGQNVKVAVDQENGLPRELDYWEWLPRRPARRATLLFRDYRAVGKFNVPHLVRKLVEGEFRGEMRLEYR